MTSDEPDNKMWTLVKDTVTIFAGLLVIAASISAFVVWLTGGIHPQNQVDVANLSEKFTTMQADVSAIKKSLADQPRPIDWTSLAAHVAGHDQQFRDLDTHINQQSHEVDARQTRDEIDAADTKARVIRLENGTNAPVRNPR